MKKEETPEGEIKNSIKKINKKRDEQSIDWSGGITQSAKM